MAENINEFCEQSESDPNGSDIPQFACNNALQKPMANCNDSLQIQRTCANLSLQYLGYVAMIHAKPTDTCKHVFATPGNMRSAHNALDKKKHTKYNKQKLRHNWRHAMAQNNEKVAKVRWDFGSCVPAFALSLPHSHYRPHISYN